MNKPAKTPISPFRLRNAVSDRVLNLADQLGAEPTQVIHDLVTYALDHVHVGEVTRPGLIFDGGKGNGKKSI